MLEKFKDRKLPFKDFYQNLQKEYIVAELRSKIYPKLVDQEYYQQREMEGKRKSIENIARQNGFKSIFDNAELKQQYYAEVYVEWGLPCFFYRNEADKKERRPKDIINYFYRGIEVSIKTDEGIFKGKITNTDVDREIVSVVVEKKTIEVPFENISRKF